MRDFKDRGSSKVGGNKIVLVRKGRSIKRKLRYTMPIGILPVSTEEQRAALRGSTSTESPLMKNRSFAILASLKWILIKRLRRRWLKRRGESKDILIDHVWRATEKIWELTSIWIWTKMALAGAIIAWENNNKEAILKLKSLKIISLR
jgi:hypothetical protein